MKYPIESYETSEKPVSFFDFVTKYIINAAIYFKEKNNTENPLFPVDTHFLYLWINRNQIADYAERFLSTFNNETEKQSKYYVFYSIAIFSFCMLILTTAFLFYLWMAYGFNGIRNRILQLFRKRIPKETVENILKQVSNDDHHEVLSNFQSFNCNVPKIWIVFGSLFVIYVFIIIQMSVFEYKTVTILFEDMNSRDLMVVSGDSISGVSRLSFFAGIFELFLFFFSGNIYKTKIQGNL